MKSLHVFGRVGGGTGPYRERVVPLSLTGDWVLRARFNGDAVDDVAVVGDEGVEVIDGATLRMSTKLETQPQDAMSIDIDRDGISELAVQTKGSIAVWKLSGDTPERLEERSLPTRTSGFAVYDWDDDGWPDLLGDRWYMRNANGTLDRVHEHEAFRGRPQAVGDIDGDQRPDLVVRTSHAYGDVGYATETPGVHRWVATKGLRGVPGRRVNVAALAAETLGSFSRVAFRAPGRRLWSGDLAGEPTLLMADLHGVFIQAPAVRNSGRAPSSFSSDAAVVLPSGGSESPTVVGSFAYRPRHMSARRVARRITGVGTADVNVEQPLTLQPLPGPVAVVPGSTAVLVPCVRDGGPTWCGVDQPGDVPPIVVPAEVSAFATLGPQTDPSTPLLALTQGRVVRLGPHAPDPWIDGPGRVLAMRAADPRSVSEPTLLLVVHYETQPHTRVETYVLRAKELERVGSIGLERPADEVVGTDLDGDGRLDFVLRPKGSDAFDIVMGSGVSYRFRGTEGPQPRTSRTMQVSHLIDPKGSEVVMSSPMISCALLSLDDQGQPILVPQPDDCDGALVADFDRDGLDDLFVQGTQPHLVRGAECKRRPIEFYALRPEAFAD